MEYGSTPYSYRDGTGKKWPPHIMCTNSCAHKSGKPIVYSLNEPYLSLSSTFTTNKTVTVGREYR